MNLWSPDGGTVGGGLERCVWRGVSLGGWGSSEVPEAQAIPS